MTPGDIPPRHPLSEHARQWESEQTSNDTISKAERELHDRRRRQRFEQEMQKLIASAWGRS